MATFNNGESLASVRTKINDAIDKIDGNATISNNISVGGNITVTGTVDGRDLAADGTKLDAIEASATADQTGAEIKALYEAEADTNAFTDAEQTKLSGIEASADVTDTANVTAAGALMDSELADIAAVKALNQGVATTDDPTFTNTQLAAISETISDTAVDIFVYDTRKDSDGGAWRKRTQHTSWYNETLNTSTRGSRKEFPAVAVIVAEQEQITIYDGDDPDLPMWMVFNTNSGWSMLYFGTGVLDVSAVAMLNGKLCVTSNNNPSTYAAGVTDIDFVKDRGAIWYKTGSDGGYVYFDEPIGGRNVAALGLISISSATVVNYNLNDVAMTVLPNAPIDAATGLPVPTIAVATDGGVSVIKDDGTVVDITRTSSAQISNVDFYNGHLVIGSSNVGAVWYYDYIPSSDETISPSNGHIEYYDSGFSNDDTPAYLGYLNTKTAGTYIGTTGANDAGLTAVDFNNTDYTKSSTAWITSDYNTGWMNGDTKLATLSDTDDTDVTGSELVTNGTFDTDVSGWSAGNSATLSLDTNRLKIQSGSAYSYAYQTMTVVVGKTYTVSADLVSGNTNARLRVGTGPNSTAYLNGDILWGPSVHTHTFTATSTSLTITLLNQDADGTDYTIWDNISVRLAEEDRSVNGNGLQVFGSITKDPVATGADLVAYSFSSSSTSNYLWQPYNTDLAFGTNDFSVMFWTKAADYTPTGSGVSFVLSLDADLGAVTGKGAISIASSTLNDLRFQIYTQGYASGGRIDCIDTDAIPTNTWNCICAVRRNGVFEIWLNGQLKATNADNLTADVSNLNTDGWHILSSNQGGVSMALFRASATAPSSEQIKKIYEDEKFLFQDNAQATLYGSSDAVTALAYDDSTNLLHVGTSAGRSVFQGLRRVDNTTTAVGAAISASNGLVADE